MMSPRCKEMNVLPLAVKEGDLLCSTKNVLSEGREERVVNEGMNKEELRLGRLGEEKKTGVSGGVVSGT